jgi:hypothetical protein
MNDEPGPICLATNLSMSPLGCTPCSVSISTASTGAASKALSALVAANAGVVENNAIASANPVIFLIIYIPSFLESDSI